MKQISTIGLDLAKNVFQIHGADAEGAPVLNRKLRRAEVLRYFEKQPPCLDDRFHEIGIDETGSMELEGSWWIPRLRLAERGAVSWQDGVKRSRWR